MNTTLLLMTLLAVSATAGEPASRPSQMSVEQLLADLRPGSAAERNFPHAYVQGYFAGVADSTQGRIWCAPPKATDESIDRRVRNELTVSEDDQSRNDAASLLLEKHLKKLYPAAAGTCEFVPRLTGDRFIIWLLGNQRKPASQRLDPSPEIVAREHYADGYVSGVIDATQAKDWCAPPRIKPHELAERGWTNLVDKPPAALAGNAADLLLQEFTGKYPCRRP